MSPINQEILRNYAKEMGLNPEEVVSNAKKMAEVRYKEKEFGGSKLNGLGLSEEQKNFLINNGQVKNGQLYYTDSHGKEHNVSSSDVDSKLINEMMQFSNMSDSDILADQAASLRSIDEAITGNASSVVAAFAKGLALNENAQNIINSIDNVGTDLQGVSENLGSGANEALNKMFEWINENGPFLKRIADGVINVSKFLADNWGKLLIAIAGWKLLLKPALGANLGGNTTLGGKLGTKSLSGLKNIGQRMSRSGIAKPTMDTYRMYNARYGGSKIKNFGAALKNSWKSAPKLTKATGIAGVALGAVQGATALMDYSTKKKELKNKLDTGEITKEEYNAQINEARVNKNEGVGSAVGGTIGAAIGTAFGGPVGGIIAGYVGDKLGSFVGKHWDGITTKVKNAWNTSIDFVEGASKKALESIGGKFTEWGESVSSWWGEVASPAISEKLNSIKEGAKSLASRIKDKLSDALNSETWEKIRVSSKAIPILGTITEIIEFFKGPKEYIEKSKQTFKNVIETVTNFPKMISQWLYDYTKDSRWLPQLGHNYRDEEKAKEKHANGGIVGGNSYSGDRILTGLNSGEMVLNKNQQAALFNFINEMPSVLSKVGSNGNVSYYNARNYSNSNVTDRSLRMSYDASNLVSRVLNSITNNSNTKSSNTFNGIQTDLVSKVLNYITNNSNAENNTYNSSSIMQKYKELHSNTVGGNVSNTFNGVQTDLFRYIGNIFSSIISPFSILKNSNDVKAKPVGEREYVYTPTSDNRGNGVTEVTVRDINVNVNGTLKLDAGNFTKNIDINQLLNDSSFVSQLKDLIKQSINNDINNGRFMNDIASMRGMPSQVGLWGRK